MFTPCDISYEIIRTYITDKIVSKNLAKCSEIRTTAISCFIHFNNERTMYACKMT